MINEAMDFIFTDSLAFAINATLGTVVRTKLCNYSWEQRIKSEPPTKESGDRQPKDSNSISIMVNDQKAAVMLTNTDKV